LDYTYSLSQKREGGKKEERKKKKERAKPSGCNLSTDKSLISHGRLMNWAGKAAWS
jgi:hypothetical protein